MSGHEVGVGPWEGPLPDDGRFDPELLAEGDRRNVVDRYRYWSREAIVADLDDLAFEIERAYRLRGHHFASVAYEHSPSRGVIRVQEGNRVFIERVEFSGNTAIPSTVRLSRGSTMPSSCSKTSSTASKRKEWTPRTRRSPERLGSCWRKP